MSKKQKLAVTLVTTIVVHQVVQRLAKGRSLTERAALAAAGEFVVTLIVGSL